MPDTTRTISCRLDDNTFENIMKGKECLPGARKVEGLNPEKGAFGDKKAVERRYDKIRFCLSTSAMVRTFLISLGFKTKLRHDPKSEETIKSAISYIRREPHEGYQVALNSHQPSSANSQHCKMPLTVLSDSNVKQILNSLTKEEVETLQTGLRDSLHEYSTATNSSGAAAVNQPKRTVLESNNGTTSLFMPSTSSTGIGMKR